MTALSHHCRKADLSNHWDRIGKHPKGIQDLGYEPVQALGMVQMADMDEDDFELLATHYKLEGAPRIPLCQWNRSVSQLPLLHTGEISVARQFLLDRLLTLTSGR